MSQPPAEQAPRGTTPLVAPLIVVSVIAVIEAIVLAILLVRDPSPAPVAAAAPQHGSSSAGQIAPPAHAAAPREEKSVPRGTLGQRVESAGFGITVEKIVHEPGNKDFLTVGPDQRYLALLITVDNNTGGNAGFYPVMFRLQDEQGFEYEPLNLHATSPTLEWRNMGNRESVRGYQDFLIPKTARGLTLVYSHLPRSDSQPIRIELGE